MNIGNQYLPTTITMANNTSYSIVYESTDGTYPSSTVTGRIHSVTLPTGGVITYSYSGGTNGINCTDGSPAVLTKQTPDGSWTFIHSSGSTLVTDPSGNDTIYAFGTSNVGSSYEVQRLVYQGGSHTIPETSGTLLKTLITCYNNNAVNCSAVKNITLPITQKSVYVYLPALSTASVSNSTYSDGVLLTSDAEYDFDGTTLLDKEVILYGSYSNGTCSPLGNNIINRPCMETEVDGAGHTLSQNIYTYDAAGNTLIIGRLAGSKFLTRTLSYNPNGTVKSATDFSSNQTGYIYAQCNGSYVSEVNLPLEHTKKMTWDCNGGRPLTSTDENGQQTTYTYNDQLWRWTEIDYPDGGRNTSAYSDTATPPNLVQTKLIDSSHTLASQTNLDSLGRVSATILASDPDGTTYTASSYDSLGRIWKSYGPTRCYPPTTNCGETTWGITTYGYDALGRVTSVMTPDNSVVSTNYLGNCMTVTDETGNARKSCSDALARLTGVWEDPGTSPHLNYETDYQYDALGNLTSVTQKGSAGGTARIRTFQYDSLSRLTSASNPESGTISYVYDADSNLSTKTAPSPNQGLSGTNTVVTTYTYDALNRLTGKSYNDSYTSNSPTPAVSFAYDGNALTACATAPPTLADSYPVGRRTSMCDGSGATSWKHDVMGRILQERRTIGAVMGDYENDVYNLDGSPTSVSTLGYSTSYYSAAGRPTSATHSSTKFVSGATYAPPGELTGMTMGSATGFAGITVANAYNNRLQPILLSAASPSGTLFSECFDYHLGVAVNVPPCSFSAGTAGDNGSVYQIVNNRDSTRTQNFLYDSLNRIQQAYSSGSLWGETFGPVATNPGVAPTTSGIDAWGNMTNRSGVNGKTNFENLSVAVGSNNRLIGLNYDPAGNMTSNGSVQYLYDDENRLIWTNSSSSYRYLYDGNGERVEKCVAATSNTAFPTSGTSGTLYWKGSGSAALSETDLSGNVQNTYIFFNGQRVARSDSAGAVHYYLSDHLGSHGVVENATGSACEQDIDYYPYGGAVKDFCTTQVQQNYKFTGKERDPESGLDFFGARYDTSSLGRFMTPDPVSGTPLHLVNPQRWNMYSYVINNPLTYVDPDGRDAIAVNFVNEVPLGGHEGIIVVHADGSATYARFGPQQAGSPADQGKVDVQQLKPITFRDDGLPTVKSYQELSDEVAKVEGQATNTVGLNYFKTSEADSIALDNWMKQMKEASDRLRAPDYRVNSQNCATFCIAGLLNAHAVQNQGLSIIPNRLFRILSGLSAENYSDRQRSKPREKVTTRITGCKDMEGNPCTQ
jgi:RHS repeat-associated protein